ncbi:hypothetical protein RD110_15730 [Rhodoferax koreense]|uniref:Uncharacterized protein n=1 Tax=Rhodoferax koreensis TaxID=1842727 RepID=A0A1P8JXQ0_9BURK|nr:hypothetical protein RD110_15730 [Rhodoferax koreense]
MRAAAATLAGKQMELCYRFGDIHGAKRHMREMHAQIEARRAARDTGCYFTEQGHADGTALRQEADHG